MLANTLCQHLPSFRKQEFGITQPANAVGRVENDRRSDDRSKERTATDFIDSCHAMSTESPSQLFELQCTAQAFQEPQFGSGGGKFPCGFQSAPHRYEYSPTSACLATCRKLRCAAFRGRALLFNVLQPRSFASETTKVVKFRAPDFRRAHKLNLVDHS